MLEKVKIDIKHKHFHGNLCIVEFIDNGHYIAYMPSLNLSGYGDNSDEAVDLLMNHVVRDYLKGLFTLTESQIFSELRKHGWERSEFFQKDLSRSAYVDNEGILRDFNLPAETKIESKIMELA